MGICRLLGWQFVTDVCVCVCVCVCVQYVCMCNLRERINTVSEEVDEYPVT